MGDVLSKEQEELNRAKYGPKDFDVISEGYRISKKVGDNYCGLNAKKYITRYCGDSHKAENLADLEKALDYLNRIIEKHKELLGEKKAEILETR